MEMSKSLSELEAVADELLAKSKAPTKLEDEEVDPKDISSNAEEASDDDNEEKDAPKSDKSSAKDEEADEEADDSKDDVKKSVGNKDLLKSDDEDEPEDEDEESEDEDDDEDDVEDVKKSIQSNFEADETIHEAIQNSEFCAAVVDVLSKSLGEMQYDIQHGERQHNGSTDILAKSLQAVMVANQNLQSENERLTRRINKIEKSISMGFEKVMYSLDEIATQPVGMRKSMASISVQDRDFDKSLNGMQTTGFNTLNKSQVLSVLNGELYAGNPNVTATDIISYESGAPLRAELQSLVENKSRGSKF